MNSKKVTDKKYGNFRVFRNNLYMLGYIIRFCKSHVFITIFSALISSLSSVLNLLITRYIINTIADMRQGQSSLIQTISLFILFVSIYQILSLCLNHYIQYVIIPKNTQIIYQKMQIELFEKASKVKLTYYENKEFYDRFSFAMQQADSRALAVLNTLNTFVSSLFGISALSVLIVGLDNILILLVVVNVIITFYINLKTIKNQHKYNSQRIPFNRYLEYIKRIFYLQNFSKELRLFPDFIKLLKSKYNNIIKKLHSIISLYGKKFTLLNSLQGSIGIVINSITILYLTYRIITGQLQIGDFVVLTGSVQQLTNMMSNLISIFPKLYEHSIYIDNFKEFMDIKLEQYQNDDIVVPITNIDLQSVSFSYPESTKQILKNICLSVNKGERIALVGHNGAGKSTLIKLLSKLYEPTEGQILINGLVSKSFSPIQLAKQIGIVFQDYQIYSITIAENVLMRKPESKNDYIIVENALQFVGLFDKVIALPDGMNSVLTREFENEGIFFSGGEMQKLALARIYAGNYSLLILDEPSSALDPLAERELFEHTSRLALNKCVIMITHRLKNIENVDRIYVMKEGEIVEVGTHEQLLMQNGYYHKMYLAQ